MKLLYTSLVVLLMYTMPSMAQTPQNDTLRMTALANVQGMLGNQYTDIWGYTSSMGIEYAIIGSRRAINIFDVSDCSNPVPYATIDDGCTTTWRDFKTYDHYVYAVSESCDEGLIVIDMDEINTDPMAWTRYNSDFTTAHNVYIDEQHARMYIVGARMASQHIDLLIYDLSDPAVPALLYNGDMAGEYIHDMYVRDNIGYASHGGNGYFAYDFTDPNNIVTLGSIDTNYGYNHSSWLTTDGQYAFVCFETRGRELKVFEIIRIDNDGDGVYDEYEFIDQLTFHDPLEPNTTNIIAHNPFIKGDSLYVSYYEDGLQIFDISNPLEPKKASYLDTYLSNNDSDLYGGFNGAWGTYPFHSSGCILVSDIQTGLYTAITLMAKTKSVDSDLYMGSDSLVFADSAGVYHALTIDNASGHVNIDQVSSTTSGVELIGSDLEFNLSTTGIIVDAPSGYWRVTIDNSGQFVTNAILVLPTDLIQTDGNIVLTKPESGIITITPNGTRKKIQINTNNNVVVTNYNY